jgi:serine/threonine-protein kinase RsbW
MKRQDFVKLSLPSDLSYLPIAQLCARETARKYGFEEEDLSRIELALEECVTNVIEHAFGVGEEGVFDVIFERIPTGIRVVIREKGMPFDPTQLPEFQPGKDLDGMSATGLGTHLMRRLMDEVAFHNLGPDGKETHLTKYLPAARVDQLCSQDQLKPESEPTGPVVIQEKIPYDVRGLQPSEAIEVSRCAYKSHGYTFFDEHIYFPDRLIRLNQSGQMLSAVAVSRDNRFMGHAALVYPSPAARIAELTFVFVNVEYRGQGCMNRLCDYLFTTPKTVPLKGLYAYAVTNHVFTQKVMVKYGFGDCGLEVGTSPATWIFKGITPENEGNAQRISVAMSFKYLEPPTSLTLYPPERHRAMIERLYENLGARSHSYQVPSVCPVLPPQASELETDLHAAEQNAEVRIFRYGAGFAKEIKALVRELCLKQVAAINLLLSLEDPATGFVCSDLERLGFFFSGILPGTTVGDALVLQYLNNVALDYGKIQMHTEMGREILAYVKAQDPNLL